MATPERSWANVVVVTRQPSFSGPNRFARGDADVGEGDRRELRAAAHLAYGPARYPRAVEGGQEDGDPLVLRGVGVGPHQQLAVGRPHPIGSPDLLAVDHELVAVEQGPGPQPGEVRPEIRLAETLTPQLLAGKDPRQMAMLNGRAPGDNRRAHVLGAEGPRYHRRTRPGDHLVTQNVLCPR